MNKINKFFQESKETWISGEFVSIDGYTDFEDDREYKIVGKDTEEFFIASGMDGELKLDKDIIPLKLIFLHLYGKFVQLSNYFSHLKEKNLCQKNLRQSQFLVMDAYFLLLF